MCIVDLHGDSTAAGSTGECRDLSSCWCSAYRGERVATYIAAERDCEIAAVHVQPGDCVAAKDLLIELKP
jgi:hypothetical protein